MNERRRFVFLILITLCVTSGVQAQSRTTTRAAFVEYMERSDGATKNSPYRRIITIESSDNANGNWAPFSSMVQECILPDRSRLVYRSGPQGEYIRIGKTQYGKESANRGWVLSDKEAQGWIVTPSSTPGFNGPIIEYLILDPEKNGTVVKVISKPSDVTDAKESWTYEYSFDDKGFLVRFRSIGYNGSRLTRRTEEFEYDPNIKIEAPI